MSGAGQAVQLTAAHVAVAIVAAAGQVGIDAAQVFAPGRGHKKARMMAAAGCCARLGCSKAAAARLFRLEAQRLAPTMLAKAGITLDHMLTVAEALQGAGLTAGHQASPPRPLSPAAEASAPARKSERAAAARKPDREDRSTDEEAAGGRRRRQPPKAASAARNAKAAAQPQRSAAPAAPARPMAHGVRRLRPMTAKKLRFARWFVAAGWDVEEVADLFDVHDDAMADALEFGVAA